MEDVQQMFIILMSVDKYYEILHYVCRKYNAN